MDLLAVLKALGDETRFSMYRELAGSTRGCSAPGARRRARPARQHRAPPPRTPARSRSGRGRADAPRHRRPAPALYSLAPGAPGLGLRPAELHAARRAARRAGRARRRRRPTRRPRSAGRGASRPGAARARESCVKALAGEMDRLGFEPAAEARRGERRPTSRSCTARSGSWPRPTPSWSATSTAGICEGVVETVGGGSVEDFATLYDRDPCRVTVAVEVT